MGSIPIALSTQSFIYLEIYVPFLRHNFLAKHGALELMKWLALPKEYSYWSLPGMHGSLQLRVSSSTRLMRIFVDNSAQLVHEHGPECLTSMRLLEVGRATRRSCCHF